MSDVRPVFYILGLFLAALAVAMMIPALVDVSEGNKDWEAFAAAAGLTLFVGVALTMAFRTKTIALDLRLSFLLTALTWIVLSAFGALPFVFSSLRVGYADAYFETVSGFTTTGSTVLEGLDAMPPGILLWRGILQGIGGAGIIVMAIAILPFLRIGGMQLFRAESSDRSDKVLPRISTVATATMLVYAGLIVLCAFLFWLAGMSGFDAIIHSFATLSTGGFGNYDASIGKFGSPTIEWITTLFMFIGGCPLVLFILVARGQFRPLLVDSQVRTFLAIILAASAMIAVWLWLKRDYAVADAIRRSLFHVTSVITTTGFAAEDYGNWGGLPSVIFLLLMYVGGCTGSTAGAIKVFRFEIIARRLSNQVRQIVQPHGVFTIRYMGRAVSEDIPVSIMAFAVLYILCTMALTLALTAFGLDFVTALSGAVTAIGNVGPGLGEIIGPASNFKTLPDAAKWLLSFGMLLGRLELFTILVLFTPRLWRG